MEAPVTPTPIDPLQLAEAHHQRGAAVGGMGALPPSEIRRIAGELEAAAGDLADAQMKDFVDAYTARMSTLCGVEAGQEDDRDPQEVIAGMERELEARIQAARHRARWLLPVLLLIALVVLALMWRQG